MLSTRASDGKPPPDLIYMEADQVEGRVDKDITAQGKVRLWDRTRKIDADWMRYLKDSDEVKARGNILMTKEGNELYGAELKLKLSASLGYLKPARFILYSEQRKPSVTAAHPSLTPRARPGGRNMARGDAEEVLFEGRDKYRMTNAEFTTCPVGNQDWYLQAKDLNLDYTTNVGSARDVRVRYLGATILYTPWMDFALDRSRKSGFLTPTYGVSDQRGIELLTPWYWNIAPNRDATFYPRYMTKRGLQLGAQYRYLEKDYRGDVYYDYLPSDKLAGHDRFHLLLHHEQSFDPNWFGNLTFERVSDNRYFSDLSSNVTETSQVNLLQEAAVRYNGGWWTATGRIQSYQTLQDPNAPVTPPYKRLPQLLFSGSKFYPGSLPLKLDMDGEFDRFEHTYNTMAAGNRLDLYPRLSLPMTTTFGFFTPKVGWRYTWYDLGRNPLGDLSQVRSLPILSLDSGIYLERDLTFLGRDYLQTLEPRAYYVYIPYRNQNGIPLFDTAIRDLTLDQLFSENQFSGADRVNDANQLTLALTSRLTEHDTGIERLQATVGQRFYFKDQQVTLNPGDTTRSGDTSDLLLNVSGQINNRVRMLSGVQYNTQTSTLIQANLGASYSGGPGRVLNADYRYTKGSINQIDVSTEWPLMPRWYGLGRVNYSIRDRSLIEGLIGLEYNAGCWSLRGVAQRLATSTTKVSNAFFLQLELNGLTTLGPNPLDVLRHSISGYVKSDEINQP